MSLYTPVKKVEQAIQTIKKLSYEKEIRAYFKDIPALAEVSKCESSFRQYNAKGEVLPGALTPHDRGAMQINETYHRKAALKLGYDIDTLYGNLGYARYLYYTQGLQPWRSSRACWAGTV